MEFFKANIIPGEVIVQILAFLIVFWTLKALAWKPLLGALAARRERIQSDFDKIEAARKEIENLRTEYSQHLAEIEEEARTKIQEAVNEGRKIAREIQDRARSESQATFEKAKENVELEIAKARITLRREIADLAIRVSERVVGEKMRGAGAQEEKVLEIIEDLEKSL